MCLIKKNWYWMKSFPEISAGVRFTLTCTVHVYTPVDDSPCHNPTGSNWSSAPNPLRTTPTQLIDGNAPIHVLSDPGKDREDSVDTRLFPSPPFWKTWYLYAWNHCVRVPWSADPTRLWGSERGFRQDRLTNPRRWWEFGRDSGFDQFWQIWFITKHCCSYSKRRIGSEKVISCKMGSGSEGFFTGVDILWIWGLQIERDVKSSVNTHPFKIFYILTVSWTGNDFEPSSLIGVDLFFINVLIVSFLCMWWGNAFFWFLYTNRWMLMITWAWSIAQCSRIAQITVMHQDKLLF